MGHKSLLDCSENLSKPCIKWDTYIDHYEKHVSKYIGQNPVVLEIGIAKGGSLELWSKYFENGKVYGIDADEKCLQFEYEQENIKVLLGDQSSGEYWDHFLKTNTEEFDIIIDDGSHVNDDQILTLLKLFPRLKVGGTYVIEDTHTSYWSQWGGGFNKPESFISVTKTLIDLLHLQHIRDCSPNDEIKNIFRGLESVTYHNSFVVLTKENERDMKELRL
jgi:SAM-dependent methyltransferase